MDTTLCYGCMEPSDRFICPHCGFPKNGNNQPHQLRVGTLLRGQYVIGRVLGQGGFGITYLGWDRYLDTKVAIKEFFPSSMVTRDCTHSTGVICTGDQTSGAFRNSRERFLREAKALAKFEGSSAIVGIKSFFEENGTAYIIMEYVKGTSLDRYVSLRGGRISMEETLRLLQPVMDALARVHEAGMVHRDISPDNIILHPMGGAKLLDFGAVREVESPDAEQALARSTEAILKHGFAPIEQYQSRGSLGPWTDVYALCATIWYCVTGRVPTDAPARIIEDLPLAWETVPGLTDHQRDVFRKGTALRAKDRYATVGALRQDLLRETPAAAVPKEVPPTQPKQTPPPVSSPSAEAAKKTPPPGTTDGDWYCSCGQKNKVWHTSCQKCHAPKPAQPKQTPSPAPADSKTWTCTCGRINNVWYSACQKCGTSRAEATKKVPLTGTTTDGDWFCDCGQKNKVWHASCQKCGTRKPAAPMPPKKAAPAVVTAEGDWYCSCGQKNKVWHASCQKCGTHRPAAN